MINSRLALLREKMQEKGFSAYIMPLCDPHQSEYPAEHWKSMAWISGFTGSAGTVMVALDHAGLWTDSRYFIQGEQELAGSSFQLHKMKVQFHPGFTDWLIENLKEGDTVIADGAMISLAQRNKYKKALSAKGINLQITDDFIGSVWSERPSIPTEKVFDHDVNYSGLARTEKIAEVRKQMAEKDADYHLITTLDDIAWLFNLRGRDVDCNPVFVSYCLLSQDKTYLFINGEKLPAELKKELINQGIELKPYNEITSSLENLKASDSILIDKSSINVQLYTAIKEATIIDSALITRQLKAIKNATEIDHFRKVHVKDAIALTHAFYWLENTVKERPVSEYEFAMHIKQCRSEQPYYFGKASMLSSVTKAMARLYIIGHQQKALQIYITMAFF